MECVAYMRVSTEKQAEDIEKAAEEQILKISLNLKFDDM